MRFFRRDPPQKRPRVQWDDINRLLAEVTYTMEAQKKQGIGEGESVPIWCLREGVDEDVLKQIAREVGPLLQAAVLDQKTDEMTFREVKQLTHDAVSSLAIMWFMIGWDAHREYGEVKGKEEELLDYDKDEEDKYDAAEARGEAQAEEERTDTEDGTDSSG